MNDAVENWKDVPGFEGRYRVSDLGRVYSYYVNRVLKPGTYKRCGHTFVSLSVGGLSKTFTVHGLVARAFIGPAPEGQEVCHGLEGPAENALRNLRYDTRGQNVQDRKWHGKPRKLTVDQVLDLKTRLALRETHRSLAVRFSVSPGLISAIAAGKVHADV